MAKTLSQREQQDYEANVFAVCLLMPKERLLQELNKDGGMDLSDHRDERLREICKLFQVTPAMLVFRMSLLEQKPK